MNTRRQPGGKLHLKQRHTYKRMYLNILAVTFVVGWITIYSGQHAERLLSVLNISPTIIDEDGVCVNALPYAKMHDLRPKEIAQYEKQLLSAAGTPEQKSFSHKPPEHLVLPHGSSVAYWDCSGSMKKCTDNPKPNALNNMEGSAWTADGLDVFREDFKNFDYSLRREMWVPHKKYEFLTTKRTVITGDAAAFFGFYPINFGHCLHDNFPMVAWLRSIVPDSTTFILPDTAMYRKLIDFIDPTFTERVYFFQRNEIVTVEDGTLTVARPNSPILAEYGNVLFRPLRHWIFEHHPEEYPEEEKLIIFHTRAGPHTKHGRVIETQHEQDILALIRSAMVRYNRKEKLLIFSGQDEEGNILPLSEQFDIFRRAATIIGPHGSGLANMIWTYPFPQGCDKRVQLLEIIPGSDSAQVQTLYNGYYWIMRGMPIDYHQMVYASNSTMSTTYIRLDVLQQTIDDMWGSSSTVSET